MYTCPSQNSRNTKVSIDVEIGNINIADGYRQHPTRCICRVSIPLRYTIYQLGNPGMIRMLL